MAIIIERKGSLVRLEVGNERKVYPSLSAAFHDAYDRRLESEEWRKASKRLCSLYDIDALGDLPKIFTETH